MINDRIEKIINDSGMTKRKFCELVGIDYSYLFYLLQGKRNPGQKVIKSICKNIIIQDGIKINQTWLTSGVGEPYLASREIIIRNGIDSLNIENSNLKNKFILDLSVLSDEDIISVIEACDKL